MVHQKLCFFSSINKPDNAHCLYFFWRWEAKSPTPVLAATSSWEAEATGGGLQIVMPPSYLLTTVASGFRSPKRFGSKKRGRPPIGRGNN